MNAGRRTMQVFYQDREVGTLAETADRLIAFQYSASWLSSGFSISPFSLPLKNHVFLPTKRHFDGLFGVFADSLPDAWGRLLVDRMLKKHHVDPENLNVLDRLALIGENGRGALIYKPCYELTDPVSGRNLDELAVACSAILESKSSDEDPDLLFALGGSSGGARPKAFVCIDNEEWLIKFPYRLDGADSGLREYEYALIAESCGIPMAETKLFPSSNCSGFFGTKRFDRPRCHILSAAAALEVDFEYASADYQDLLKLTEILTRNDREAMQDMFRRMCFNVFGGNQDDHLKNFSFMYNEEKAGWQLTPAYDLTCCRTGFGEHTTTVNGTGKNIQEKDLMAVGLKAGLSKNICMQIIAQVRDVFSAYQAGKTAFD